MTTELDIIAQRTFAVREGRAEGRAEERRATVKSMMAIGIPKADIARVYSITEKEVDLLLAE